MSFQIGTQVKIRDGSWSRKYVDGEHVGQVEPADHDLVFTVLSDHPENRIESSPSGMKMRQGEWAWDRSRCTAVLQRGSTVVFINREFLVPATCPTCGHSLGGE